MGELVLTVPNELGQKFRDIVYKRYGMKKGASPKLLLKPLKCG
jgi:hypothetical protein